MTEPTKEELLSLAAKYDGRAFMLSRTTGAQLEVRDYRIVAECLRLAANLPSEEEIAISICQSGQFETGQGTCALICMNQLGAPRNKGCCHTKTVHKRLAARILERIRRVK